MKSEKKYRARAGIITTPHGRIETPAFSPVGTRATVKGLTPNDLKKTGTQVVLGNAYHLYLQPGLEVIKNFGGFAPFMDWDGPTITDSGGYQVSFLWNSNSKKSVNITDKGMYFNSHIDGSRHLLTPEKSMQIQNILGADIVMTFDQPQGVDYSPRLKKEAFERTLKWEERSFIEWRRMQSIQKSKPTQALFGIIHGGTDRVLTRRSLNFIINLGFPGLAFGGETIGKSPKLTARTLDTVADLLPDSLPLHALGLGGGPEGIFEAVERGVDMFDNSSVTRMARTGIAFVYPEDGGKRESKFRVNIEKASSKNDKEPISKVCRCDTCLHFSKAYIRHLLKSREILGSRLMSLHNVYFINDLMGKIRISIKNGDFSQFKRSWLGN